MTLKELIRASLVFHGVDDLNSPIQKFANILSDILFLAVVILEVFKKGAAKTPKQVVDQCKRRLRLYDE